MNINDFKWLICFFWKCKYVNKNEKVVKDEYRGEKMTITQSDRICERCGRRDPMSSTCVTMHLNVKLKRGKNEN